MRVLAKAGDEPPVKPVPQRYLPTRDLVFRKLFTSPENIRIIIGFIRDFFGLVVRPEQIRIINPYTIENYAKAHHLPLDGITDAANVSDDESDAAGPAGQLLTTERDVAIAIIDTADVTIEMQLTNHAAFLERAIYYPAAQYVSNYATGIGGSIAGSKYRSLKPVWGLNILGFNLFDNDAAFRDFSFRNNATGEPLPKDLIRVGFFELLKQADNEQIAAWSEFFTTGQAPADAPEYIQQAAKLVDYHNFTPQERRMIDLQEKAQAIAEAREEYVRDEGWREGRDEGRDEGRLEEKREIAESMLANGEPLNKIAQYTGLSPSELTELGSPSSVYAL